LVKPVFHLMALNPVTSPDTSTLSLASK